jgi:hypothetical protein
VFVSPAADDIERFASAHSVAYRAAAALVPAETCPFALPTGLDAEDLVEKPVEAQPSR